MAAPHAARTGPSAGPDGPAGSDRDLDRTCSFERAERLAEVAGDDEATQAACQGRRGIRSWPLLLLALPASVAVWSGWVGIGRLTGFGEVRPLPGIWNSLHLDTAVTLPVGVEAYAAYALHAWLATSVPLTDRTRRFAKWSAIGSLLLGMAGQVAYHLLTQAGTTRAPWGVTSAVSCLPVLILGMAAGLAHLIRADAAAAPSAGSYQVPARTGQRHDAADLVGTERLTEAQGVAARLVAAGQRVSRRTLRAAGLHGSNVELGALAQLLGAERGQPDPDRRRLQPGRCRRLPHTRDTPLPSQTRTSPLALAPFTTDPVRTWTCTWRSGRGVRLSAEQFV